MKKKTQTQKEKNELETKVVLDFISEKMIVPEKDISPADLNITSRQINYWIDSGIVPFVEKSQKKGGNSNKTKWIRLDIYQAIWACLVKELIKINVSINDIKKITHDAWEKPMLRNYAYHKLQSHIQNTSRAYLTREEKTVLKEVLSDKEKMDMYLNKIMNPFTILISDYIFNREQFSGILFYKESLSMEFLKKIEYDLRGGHIGETLIFLPILPIISFVLTTDFLNPKKEISYFTKIQNTIRDIITENKASTIIFRDTLMNNDLEILCDEKSDVQKLIVRFIANKNSCHNRMIVEPKGVDRFRLNLIK